MKYLIIIMAMSAGLAHGQFNVVVSPTNITEGAGTIILPAQPPQVLSNLFNSLNAATNLQSDYVIKRAIENGEVCRVRGKHEWQIWWGEMWLDGDGSGTLISNTRRCDVCGRKEIRQEVWKEEKQ